MKLTRFALLAAAIVGFGAPAFADTSAGTHLDDTTVNASVKTALIGNGDVKARDINVETYKGMVQLAGFLDSKAMIDAAVATAKGVDGVKSVSNRLAVRAPTRSMGVTLDDTTMTSKVKAAITDSDSAKGLSVNVEVNDGVVLLSGFAPGQASKDAAGKAATAAGAKKVLNYIDLKK